MTENEAYGQASENGRQVGYEEGKKDAVKHGRWKYYKKEGIAVCTECSFERKLDDDFGAAVSCPNCGARMDRVEGA